MLHGPLLKGERPRSLSPSLQSCLSLPGTIACCLSLCAVLSSLLVRGCPLSGPYDPRATVAPPLTRRRRLLLTAPETAILRVFPSLALPAFFRHGRGLNLAGGGLLSASPPGAPPESFPVLGPFQASRPSRASTISAELTAPPTPTANEASVLPGAGPPPSATAAVPALAGDPNTARPGDPYTALASQREGAWLTYQPRLGSYAACGSCPCPGSPIAPTQLFGSAMERSAPLPLHRLQYDWQQYARAGVTVAELLSRACLRPDLVRIRRIHEAGLVDEASFALPRLLAEGGGVAYQIPDGIPSDGTFAYSIEEAEYVDRMAVHLFREGLGDPNRFVLPEVKGLYVCPRPYPYSKPLVALQKSACSLMQLYSVAVAHFDWSAYRVAG